MAHRALTLKYRPQTFADMVGQEHVTTVLARALEGGRVAHAYLFTGARGVGKTTSARVLAKILNCETRRGRTGAPAVPCNTCASCREITSGVALDVTEIDGASNRGIADVQALRENVRFTPTGGAYRIVIIDEVHQLSGDAFAALLKTLEEPPPHLVFIFATTDPQKLPDTIRSRTQRYDFARVPLRRVAERLNDIAARERADAEGVKFTLTEGASLLLAAKSEGSMRDAVSALDQVVSAGEEQVDEALVRRVLGLADREAFFALADAILARDPKAALHRLREAYDKGIDPRDLAEGLSEHLRHVMILKVDPEGGELVPASREDLARLREQGAPWSDNDLLRLLKLASDLGWPMRDSAQPLLHLEAAVVQMATLETGETLAELIARLEALEKRMGGGDGPAPGGGRPASGGRPAASTAPAPARVTAPPRTAPQGTGASAPAQAAPAMRAPMSAPSAAAPAPRASMSAPAAAAPAPRAPISAPPAAAPAMRAPLGGPPAAAPSAPAAVATVDAEEQPGLDAADEACWRAMLVSVNGRKRLLGAFLEESRFRGVTATALVLGMDDLHRAVIEEQENRALLDEEARRAFGRPLALRCAGLADAERPRRPGDADVRPMVARALEWFQGEAIERASRERTTG
jgi:DNA polymerase III subunit gamma/tau